MPHPSLRFWTFAVPTEGEREGREGETSLGTGRAKAAFREEPISRAALPTPSHPNLIWKYNRELLVIGGLLWQEGGE